MPYAPVISFSSPKKARLRVDEIVQSTGSDWICSALDATVVVRSPIGPQSIPVNTIKKLTAAQVAALPAKAQP